MRFHHRRTHRIYQSINVGGRDLAGALLGVSVAPSDPAYYPSYTISPISLFKITR